MQFSDSEFEGIEIRPLTPNDSEMMRKFFAVMGGESRAFFNRQDGNEKWLYKWMDGEDTTHSERFAAIIDGEAAGYVFLWDLNTLVPWLGIAVREDLRGKHLGRRLIAYALDRAKELGAGGVMLTTHVANIRGQGLYERCGFVRQGMDKDGEVLYICRFENKEYKEH